MSLREDWVQQLIWERTMHLDAQIKEYMEIHNCGVEELRLVRRGIAGGFGFDIVPYTPEQKWLDWQSDNHGGCR